MKRFPIIVMCVLFLVIARVVIAFTVEPQHISLVGSYKAIAHLFMGGLAVSAWNDNNALAHDVKWAAFWFLCLVEVASATVSRVF